jgi:serine/threonine protein kinase
MVRIPATVRGVSVIGRTAVEALYPEDPSVIGPYRLLGRLGEGGMGRVYLGRSPSGRMVAVKVVHSELAREPHFRRRFRAEIEAARRVSGMWTAPVLGYDIDSAVPWVATGYVAGPTLREVVDSLHGPLPEQSVWALAYGLSHALLAVHGSGLIHRDLKPSNVMVTLEGPKVIDFGIARSADASLVTRTGGMVGSPGYMPPEQIRGGGELTGAADVFAMGAVLAYAATGKSPFSWDGSQAATVIYRVLNDAPHLGPEDGRLKGDLRTLVLHCLAKDARERPGLAGIPPMAERRAGADYWLPSGLTARLGQVAANLLAFDGPEADRPPSSWGPRPPSSWDPRPSSSASRPSADGHGNGHGHTTQLPGELTAPHAPPPSSPVSRDAPPAAVAPPLPSLPPPAPPVWTPPTGSPMPQPAPRRRRRQGRYVLAAASGALALALSSWLVAANVGSGEEKQQAGGSDGDGTGDHANADDGASNAATLSMIGDPHTADVCALTDKDALGVWGEARLDVDYGNFNRCDVLVQHDEHTRIDVELSLVRGLSPEMSEPTTTAGDIGILEIPPEDEECERLLLPSGTDVEGTLVQVRVNMGEGPVPADGPESLCDVADVAARNAAEVMNREDQIPRLPMPRPDNSLARLNACQLLDTDDLATVPGMETDSGEPGVADWECEWESPFDEQAAELAFHRDDPKEAGDGVERLSPLSGYEAFVEPDNSDGSCTVYLQYREYAGQDTEPSWEMVRVEVEGARPVPRLCEMAEDLTAAAAERLPTP